MLGARPEIPDFVSGRGLVAEAARQYLAWPLKLSVSECAEKHRILSNPGGGYSGPWLNAKAPHLTRPMDCLSSGLYWLVSLMGPAQSGKSEVANNWLMQGVLYDPGDFIWLQADKAVMRDYSRQRISQMIRLARDGKEKVLEDKLLRTADADNIFSKLFIGSSWWFVWPVASQMRSRPVPRFVIDDFDAVPEDIDGEGDPIGLLSGRQTTFEGREVGYVTSSPSLGPKKGIEAKVESGSNEHWHWPCPSCGEHFVPNLPEQLSFERTDKPDDAKETAEVICPNHGCRITHRSKPDMMAAGLWVAKGRQWIDEKGELQGEAPTGGHASFRVDGLMGFSSWGKLAQQMRTAELEFEVRQDEKALRTFTNVKAGHNYRSKVADEKPVEASELEKRAAASSYRMKEAPPWARLLTMAIDTQGNRWELAVWAWGEGLRSALVDRFSIRYLEDGRTPVEPGTHAAHWRMLLAPMLWRYPVKALAEHSMPVANIAIDTGGIGNTTKNATAFWWMARQADIPATSITLIKGGNDPKAKLLPSPTALEAREVGSKKREGPVLFVPNVNRFKSIQDVRMRLPVGLAGSLALPRDLPKGYCAELTSEQRREDGTWETIRRPNETWDLWVYGLVAVMRHGGERVDLEWVAERMAWALPARLPGSVPLPPAPEAAAEGNLEKGLSRSPIAGSGEGASLAAGALDGSDDAAVSTPPARVDDEGGEDDDEPGSQEVELQDLRLGYAHRKRRRGPRQRRR